MDAYAGITLGAAERAAAEFPIGRRFPLQPRLKRISIDVIIRAVFGVQEPPRVARFRDLLERFLDHLSGTLTYIALLQRDLGAWSPWGRFVRVLEALHRELQTEIDTRRGSDALGEDIMSRLLEARDEDGIPLGDDDLRDELVTLLAAGHDTTSSAMAWALEQILRNPDVETRLLDEIGPADTALDPSALVRAPYLDAVCKETLRLYPVVPAVSRSVTGSVEIAGWRFEPGISLVLCMFLAHRDETLYPEPERFRPERFLERQYAPYEFLPFGGGLRHCIGASFALYEMKLVLATLLRRFRLTLARRGRLRSERRNVTVCPLGGTVVTAAPRESGYA